MNDISYVKATLIATFKIKDLGQLRYFLGLEIVTTHDILANVGMLNAKHVRTPMANKNEVLFDQNSTVHNVNTKPDITFVVQFLSQFIQTPSKYYHQAIQWILRYIKASPVQGIFCPKNSILQLEAFSDSDWASRFITRRSTTGYCIFFGDSLISWRT